MKQPRCLIVVPKVNVADLDDWRRKFRWGRKREFDDIVLRPSHQRCTFGSLFSTVLPSSRNSKVFLRGPSLAPLGPTALTLFLLHFVHLLPRCQPVLFLLVLLELLHLLLVFLLSLF